MTPEDAAETVRAALKQATQGLIDRQVLVDLIVLAAIANEHLLVIGPPGTAKSIAVRRVAQVLGGHYFEYLLGRFTEPNEIFGPVNLTKLKEGSIHIDTQGMLPEAEVAFLDELFLGSTAILNTLLAILNERQFRRGHTDKRCPLKVCVGASNEIPVDEALAAFADRFLVRAYVKPVPDSALEALLEGGRCMTKTPQPLAHGMQCLSVLSDAADAVPMQSVYNDLSQCVRLLRNNGIYLSDRRIVKSQQLIAAACVLAGRREPSQADLWPLIYTVPGEQEQELAKDVLRDTFKQSENSTLQAAAEEASQGPLARSERIVEQSEAIFQELEQAEDKQAVQLKLEALAREIDAGFSPYIMPPPLQQVRERIVQMLQTPA